MAAKYLMVFMLLSVSGCVNQAIHDTQSADLSKFKSICVERFENDKRHLNGLIAERLSKLGVQASAEDKCPENVDAVLTYRDKWRWDMSTYMLGISMKLNDPNTGFPLAFGQALHTSLTRQTPEETIDEVLGNMFSENR